MHSTAIELRHTGTVRGRGVFARRGFARGELIETVPVLVIKCDFDDLPEAVKTYVFDWETLARVPRTHALALGYGSMYNHSNPANLRYEADAREHQLRFIAAREIRAGEELTINYNAEGGAAECADNNWFERHDIDLLE
jgi:uncharacterized protein